MWNDARRGGQKAIAKELKAPASRCGRTPKISPTASKASWPTSPGRTRGPTARNLLKEQLRQVFHQDNAEEAIALLARWLARASRSQLPAFVKVARTIREHKVRIHAAFIHDLTNARVESTTGKLRLIMRRAFGFRSVEALIGLAMLAHGGLCPPLPGRTASHRPTDR